VTASLRSARTVVTTDRWFTFPARPDVVRRALGATGSYRHWWPWLTKLDADGLFAGATWRCTVRSPLRTSLIFRLQIDRADTDVVTARLDGDLVGSARISLLNGAEHTTELHLEACLQPRGNAVAALARLVPTLAQRSHDRIVDTGARQFAAALRREP